jgi:hypothetical protein
MARQKNPYNVVPIQHGDVYDFKELQKTTLKYSKVDSCGKNVNWLKIKWIRFSKNERESILFKYMFDEEFKQMRVIELDKNGTPKTTLDDRNYQESILFKYMFDEEFKQMRFIELDKNGTPKTTLDGQELPRKYKTKQAITMAKKKDLFNLCKTKIIPPEYHGFYKTFSANAKFLDKLPDPDIEEEDETIWEEQVLE